jgi:hypothetical protein
MGHQALAGRAIVVPEIPDGAHLVVCLSVLDAALAHSFCPLKTIEVADDRPNLIGCLRKRCAVIGSRHDFSHRKQCARKFSAWAKVR